MLQLVWELAKALVIAVFLNLEIYHVYLTRWAGESRMSLLFLTLAFSRILMLGTGPDLQRPIKTFSSRLQKDSLLCIRNEPHLLRQDEIKTEQQTRNRRESGSWSDSSPVQDPDVAEAETDLVKQEICSSSTPQFRLMSKSNIKIKLLRLTLLSSLQYWASLKTKPEKDEVKTTVEPFVCTIIRFYSSTKSFPVIFIAPDLFSRVIYQ